MIGAPITEEDFHDLHKEFLEYGNDSFANFSPNELIYLLESHLYLRDGETTTSIFNLGQRGAIFLYSWSLGGKKLTSKYPPKNGNFPLSIFLNHRAKRDLDEITGYLKENEEIRLETARVFHTTRHFEDLYLFCIQEMEKCKAFLNSEKSRPVVIQETFTFRVLRKPLTVILSAKEPVIPIPPTLVDESSCDMIVSFNPIGSCYDL